MPVRPEREYRRIDLGMMELRDAEDGQKTVSGYATTFGVEYQLWKDEKWELWESVDARAFDDTDTSDVIMQYDHQGRVFARTRNHTLRLEVDPHGLKITADLGGTELGRQLYEEIKGGYTDRMSFSFHVSGQERWEEELDGVTKVHRKITKIDKLYDVSAVPLPANDTTEIKSARSLGEGVIAEITEERRVREERRRRIQKIKIQMEVLK